MSGEFEQIQGIINEYISKDPESESEEDIFTEVGILYLKKNFSPNYEKKRCRNYSNFKAKIQWKISPDHEKK
jgi:hypothetical protein